MKRKSHIPSGKPQVEAQQEEQDRQWAQATTRFQMDQLQKSITEKQSRETSNAKVVRPQGKVTRGFDTSSSSVDDNSNNKKN